MTHLERLVDPEQLIAYPSSVYRNFNRAYEDAMECISNNERLRELYIIQYRDNGGQLYFGFVSEAQIDVVKPNSSYGLEDICGVVRKYSFQRSRRKSMTNENF